MLMIKLIIETDLKLTLSKLVSKMQLQPNVNVLFFSN